MTTPTLPVTDPTTPAASALAPHTPIEDVLAILCATALIALGATLYAHDRLLTGGMAGLAFVLHYATGIGFGKVFFVLNLPFYALAWQRMERAFVLKTVAAVTLISVLADWTPHWVQFGHLTPLYATLIGGVLMGTGFLMLFRHRTSLGGVGILAFYLQERRGWKAGHVQLMVDCVILLLALFPTPLPQVALSVLGAAVLNLVLAMNHRKDRYIAS